MKRSTLLFSLLGIILLIGIAASTVQTTSIFVRNGTDEVQLRLRSTVAQTANWFECSSDGTLKFALPSTGIVPLAYGGTAASTAAGARSSLGLPESSTNSVLPLAAGGTASALADPDADRLLFWDDSAGSNTFATVGTALAITGTTLAVSTVPIANGGTGAATAAAAKTGLGIQFGSGTCAEDGTVTNTFGTAFSSAPKVVITPSTTAVLTNIVSSVTESNFVATLGAGSATFDYIAIGAP